MKGTIKRVGRIFHDGHGALQSQGWEFSEGSDFTLQDLINISETYPEGGGPYTFGSALIEKPRPKPQKQVNKHPFLKHKKFHR
jgi:hypothetical protein